MLPNWCCCCCIKEDYSGETEILIDADRERRREKLKSTISGPTPCQHCPERYPNITEDDEYEDEDENTVITQPDYMATTTTVVTQPTYIPDQMASTTVITQPTYYQDAMSSTTIVQPTYPVLDQMSSTTVVTPTYNTFDNGQMDSTTTWSSGY